jgi:peptidoglycan/LPS O-acetylase OafA/YrhL
VALLKQSDATLVQLTTMAAAAVLIWESIRQAPEPWRERLRSAYLLGLLILFLYLIGGQMDTTAYTVGVTIVMFIVGGWLAVWWVKRKGELAQQARAIQARAMQARLQSMAQTQPGVEKLTVEQIKSTFPEVH